MIVERPVFAEGMAAVRLRCPPGYTAHRAVNAVPPVCASTPGIRTTLGLPTFTATLA